MGKADRGRRETEVHTRAASRYAPIHAKCVCALERKRTGQGETVGVFVVGGGERGSDAGDEVWCGANCTEALFPFYVCVFGSWEDRVGRDSVGETPGRAWPLGLVLGAA